MTLTYFVPPHPNPLPRGEEVRVRGRYPQVIEKLPKAQKRQVISKKMVSASVKPEKVIFEEPETQEEIVTDIDVAAAGDIKKETPVVREAVPLYKVNPPPEYPRLARKRGYQGTVVLDVLVDQKSLKGAPVIFETNPTYHNVLGQIEKRAHMGTIITDFSMVQAGSLLRANGGYLIMEIESILINPFVWEALKRALQNKLLSIEDLASGLGYGTSSLRPEPIPLEVKVVLFGSYHLFHLLQNYDSKFNKIFKVRADFDHEVEKNQDTIQQYARFIARVCKE